MIRTSLAASFAAVLLSLAPGVQAADSQATAVQLIAMPGAHMLKLMDLGVMPKDLPPGTMIMLCDSQCQAVLHLAGKPSVDGKEVAMGITMYVDAHSTAAKLLGGK